MKNYIISVYYFSVIALAALLLAGCQKDGVENENGYGAAVVRFAPAIASIGRDNGQTKSDAGCGSQTELMLSSADGNFTLPMTCEVSEGINLGSAPSQTSDSIATKGSLINGNGGITDAGFAEAIGNAFWVTAWDNAATPSRIIPDQVMSGYTTADGKYQKVMYRTKDVSGKTLSVPYWMTMQPQTVSGASEPADDEYIWTEDEVKTFYAYANLPENGASVTNSSAAVQTLTYNVPATAAAQTDILMGFYSGKGNTDSSSGAKGTAGISFAHPLTAVRFKLGVLTEGVEITGISIYGVYTSGKTTQTSSTGTSFAWTKTDGSAYSVSDETGTAGLSGTDVDEDGYIGEALLLIPQTFASDGARISVDLSTPTGNRTVYAPLKGTSWSSGSTNVYTIDYDNSEWICFSAPTSHTVSLNFTTPAEGQTFNVEYSTDARNWEGYTSATTVSFGPDNGAYFRGVNPKGLGNGDNGSTFQISAGSAADVSVTGNIMGLIKYSDTTVDLPDNAFVKLFYGCWALKTAENLKFPMSKMSAKACRDMFNGCTGLKTAPELPAKTMAQYCYCGMFKGCTSLEKVPSLPATTTAEYCYSNMFYGCTGLEKAMDVLPATTARQSSYDSMFQGCTSLEKAPDILADKLNMYTCRLMFSGCTSLTEAPEFHPSGTYHYCCDKMFADCISLKKLGKLRLPAKSISPYSYREMFSGCTSLEEAPELPATSLSSRGYCCMFQNCKQLKKAPSVLPFTTMAIECCSGMFSGCSSLKEAPDLPADKFISYEAHHSYSNMFAGCTSLEKAPELPATTLTTACYGGMFSGCSSLKEAPDLPAMTLASNCYSDMFKGCTSLKEAPELPATTLASSCYWYMFHGCTSLEKAPELPAPTYVGGSYTGMFYLCSNLNSIKIGLTVSPGSIPQWVNGVAATGTFTKKSGVEYPGGDAGRPSGWTVIEY